jgi:hypothetical protein
MRLANSVPADDANIAWSPQGNLAFASDRAGLRVFSISPQSSSTFVGEYRAPLLSILLRERDGRLVVLDDSRVAEVCRSTLSLYDVSNPSQPTRIGFYNLGTDAWQRQILTVGGHLVVQQIAGGWRADQLIVLENPGHK